MIPSQHLYTIELFSSFKPILKRHFILHCSDDIIKLFCNCLFNIKEGAIELKNVKPNTLKKNKLLIQQLCSPKIRLAVKRTTGVQARTKSFTLAKNFNIKISETTVL